MLQFALGQAFDSGLGVEKDDSKAVDWYRKAAEQGLLGAMYFLEEKLQYGEGVHDPEEAINWYRKAAEGSLPEAQYTLGEYYLLCEVEPVFKNWREAAFWFRKAAEQGHSNAQLRFAGMNEDGLGIHRILVRPNIGIGEPRSRATCKRRPHWSSTKRNNCYRGTLRDMMMPSSFTKDPTSRTGP